MNKTLILLLVLSLTSLLPLPVRAQFWDPNGTVPGTGVSGNWDTVTANWSSGPDLGGNAVWVQNSTGSFNVDSNYTVTVVEPITVGGMTVAGTNGTLTIDRTSVNGLSLGADSIFNIGGSRTVSLSAPIAGGFILTKSGNGTLNLSGANTYSGGTTLSGGTVGIGIDSVSSGGVITSGAFGTGEVIVITTASTMTASGAAHVVHNPVTLNIGLTVAGSQNLTFTNGTFMLNGAARTLTVSSTADTTLAHSLTDDGTARTLTKAGTGRLIMKVAQPSTFLGGITASAGTLTAGNALPFPTNNFNIITINASTLDLNGFDVTLSRLAGNATGKVLLGTNTLTAVNNSTAGTEFSGVISGTGGYVKAGTISQTLSGTNTFSGGITIKEGPIYFSTNGLTGDAIALGAGTNIITISSLGTNTGSIGAARGTSILTNKVVLANVGPTALFDCANSGTLFVLAGPVSGSGGFLRSDKGSGIGIIITGDNTFTGGVLMTSRSLMLGHKNALGTGTLTIGDPTTPPPGNRFLEVASTVDLTGANAITNPTTVNQSFSLNTTNLGSPIDFGLELSGPVTLSSGTKAIGSSGIGLVKISGVISGSGGINKGGPNTLTLSGNNTYTGSTIVSNGPLALIGSGSVAASSDITMLAGATLDVSGRTDGTLTVGAAQTMRGDSAFNIVGSLTNNGTIEMKVAKSGSITSDNIQGLNQIRYGGTLSLVLSGDPLAVSDSIKLFDATNGYFGSFATIVPATPGGAFAWNTSTLTTDGTLRIVPLPTFTGTTLSGTNLVMSGTNGVAGAPFSVVSSTSITTPRSNWTVVQSSSFDVNGDFSVTNGISPGEPQRYFSIRVP